jgi:hypothetical protein
MMDCTTIYFLYSSLSPHMSNAATENPCEPVLVCREWQMETNELAKDKLL